MKTEKKPKEAKRRTPDEKVSAATDAKKRPDFTAPTPPPDRPPPLLRESRNTSAALALLEKGIKLIYQKDMKKARHELEQLIHTYSDEAEIVARARTYLQICDRESAPARKAPAGTDQLYTLGVMDHNRGNYEGAISYFRQSLENHPEADYVHYSAAASLAMKGNAAAAIDSLRRAIELNEDNRVYAKNDTDFVPLHSNKEFVALVGLSQPSSNTSGHTRTS